jgi:RimJ/RimL family protein N-acetyltransferase
MVKVLLREAKYKDVELILKWRNNPFVWQGSYSQNQQNRPITWYEHWQWWCGRVFWQTFIILVDDKDIGYINISKLNKDKPEIGIAIGETELWGKGIGKQALNLAIEWIKENGYKTVYAGVLKDNERSLKLFNSIGFKVVGDAREGELALELIL